jgi:hypothetical protein
LYHLGFDSRADAYLDTTTRSQVKERLRLANSRAQSAEAAANRNDTREAVRLYRVIFGERFPAYG